MSDALAKVAEKVLEPAADLIKRIGGPVADEIGEYLAASARPYTVVRQVEAVVKAQRMLAARGLPAHSVPPRLLLPILEGASIEDEEDLHTKWSALLANAASSDKVHPSYIEILKQLTPDDARLLDELYEHTNAKGKWLNDFLEEEGDEDGIPFQNLVRLGLIESTYDVDGMEVSVRPGHTPYVSGEMDQNRWLTDFAVAFIEACRAPNTVDAQ
jgi:Abortive infection alpha